MHPHPMGLNGLKMHSPLRIIAVIDDDDRVRESLHNLLASYGYNPEAFASAELFFASDGLSKSNCIIADIQTRQMTGLELLERVRSSQPEVPVIIITGKPSSRSEAFYLDKGANGFFRKPIDGQAFMALIDHLLT
jgi:FixJ family two-component response regulator